MLTIYNRLIPFRGFIAINLFGILFVRKEYAEHLDEFVLKHESIHTKQCWEMLGIFFYLWYLIEYLIRLIQYKDALLAYINISFEREAKRHERELHYKHPFYGWIKYL